MADPRFTVSADRENLKTFPKRSHLLSGIRGPLAVEGGTTTADRSLRAAVLLPGEGNRPLFRVAPQPPESQQVDTLNIFDDSSQEDLTGTLSAASLTGLNMNTGLNFSSLLCTDPTDATTCGHPFGESPIIPGGIGYGSLSLDANGVFQTNGSQSTIEDLNILLGEGNDHLTIQSSLIPGADHNPDGSLGRIATPRRPHERPRRRQRPAHGSWQLHRHEHDDHALRRGFLGERGLRRRPADHRRRDAHPGTIPSSTAPC